MHGPFDDVAGRNVDSGEKPEKIVYPLKRRLVELWLFSVLVTFFLIRVLGSNLAQSILGHAKRWHLP
jgi:hypothetical protein